MFEIEELIQPIDEASPAGRDLRLDPGDLTFQTLKDYTTVVDASVAESESDVREPNWSGVESLCVSALREKSKDLELAAALAQAWTQLEGAAGARQGLELVRQLLDRYWDSLHPGVDPDDGEISLPLRGRWLSWLDSPGGFVKALKQGPLLAVSGGESYSWQDHENSALLDDATLSAERRQELVDAGVIGEGQWKAALGSMGTAQLAEIGDALAEALETARAMAALCAERFGDEEAPDFYNLRNALEEMRDYIAPHAGGPPAESGHLGDPGPRRACRSGRQPERRRRRLTAPPRREPAPPGGFLETFAPRAATHRAARNRGEPMPESVFDKKKRIRPPRVNITYEVELGGAMVMKELPFVVGVISDLSGHPKESLGKLKDRKFVEIDRDNFDDVLSSMKPRLQMRVDNTLTGEGELSVELAFDKLSDFEPESIVQQVEPLRKLLEVRGKLKDLQSRAEGNDRLEEMLNAVIENEAIRSKLKDATGVEVGGAAAGGDGAGDEESTGGDE